MTLVRYAAISALSVVGLVLLAVDAVELGVRAAVQELRR